MLRRRTLVMTDRLMSAGFAGRVMSVGTKRHQKVVGFQSLSSDFTGQAATLEGDGRTFAEIEGERATKAA